MYSHSVYLFQRTTSSCTIKRLVSSDHTLVIAHAGPVGGCSNGLVTRSETGK